MATVLLILFLLAAFTLIFISKRKLSSLSFLRGPSTSSYLLGHELALIQQSDVGDLEIPWMKEYGPTFRTYGCFGEHILMVADPKALQYIQQSQNYPKPTDIRLIAERVFGKGLLWATGEAHQRLRRAISPAFSPQQLKQFLPLFQEVTDKLVQKWDAELEGDSTILDVAQWIPKITLDVIGRGAFDFNFGVLDGTAEYNELYLTIRDMFIDSTSPSAITVLYSAIRRRLPKSFGFKLFTTKEDRRLSAFLSAAQSAAKSILMQKLETRTEESYFEEKDILGVLINSLHQKDPRKRLSEDEIISQIATFVLAGNETSGRTMAFVLYELALHEDSQAQVYQEIVDLRTRRGKDDPLTYADYDSMPYFNAVIKECLRLHPILYCLPREASSDDTIPLSIPVKGESGTMVSSVPVRRKQRILLSLNVYNRLPQVWGDDADSWNPTRFFHDKADISIGVYGNLATFSGGVRSCIGWQFAIMELQVILFQLLEAFKFALPPGGLDIQRIPSILMFPMVRGRPELGIHLPLEIKRRGT